MFSDNLLALNHSDILFNPVLTKSVNVAIYLEDVRTVELIYK